MVDPVKLVSDAEQSANAAVASAKSDAAAALNFGQKWWWAVALGAFLLGVIIEAVV